jgi:[ribosomal protein S5]-alanine N-acetyltransferase
MDVPPIRTLRLDLVPMTPEFIQAVLAGHLAEAEQVLGAAVPAEPLDAVGQRFLSHRIGQLRRDPDVQRWLARAIVRREGGRVMVGNVGFHGQPGVNATGNELALEIGYGILPGHRGQGYATAAVEGLIEWARTQGIDHFIASVAPDNKPSLAILRKLGFVRTGQHIDPEDGLEHVLELHD